MRKLILFLSLVGVMAAGTYAASPFLAAWEIREAMRTGDTATLARRVDWPAVRQSLKRSATETRRFIGEMSQEPEDGAPRAGLWQRIKAATAAFVADPLIDRYVTAEGAPQLWSLRQTWRQKVRPTLGPALGMSEPATPLSATPLAGSGLDRGMGVARRLERAAFATPTRLELELRDRTTPERRFRGAMELRNNAWMLTELQIVRVSGTGKPVGAGATGGATLEPARQERALPFLGR